MTSTISRKAACLFGGVSLLTLGFVAPAMAQDAEPVTVAAAEDDEAVQERVVVTGSRIARSELATTAPIVSV